MNAQRFLKNPAAHVELSHIKPGCYNMSYVGDNKETRSGCVPLLCMAPLTIVGVGGILPSSATQKSSCLHRKEPFNSCRQWLQSILKPRDIMCQEHHFGQCFCQACY